MDGKHITQTHMQAKHYFYLLEHYIIYLKKLNIEKNK